MLGLLILLLLLLVSTGLLYFRYVLSWRRSERGSYGGVQHTTRMPAPKLGDELFLPGSRLGERVDSRDKELDTLEVKAEITRPKKKKNQTRHRGIIRNKADIRRSYIVDALLERPKF
jgi:hypothetical protein